MSIPKWLQEEMAYLDKQSDLYYNNGDSEISDAEFDQRRDKAVDELHKYDKSHRFLFKVGTAIPDKTPWKVVKHEYPLGSQSKVQTLEEFDKWYKPKYGRKLVVQEKLDGISISLIYENGKLIDAITRGDGFQGESILRNVERIPNVPNNIEFEDRLLIRGEILLPKSAFDKYDLPYKNVRNGCSGIAKNFNGLHASILKVVVYTVQNVHEFGDIKTEMESLDFLEDQGFELVTTALVSPQGIHDMYKEYADGKRGSLDHDIDGLVIKTNQIDLVNFDFNQNNWERPKNQIALKFAHEEAISYIVEIEASIGGEIICPVAIIDPPVDLAGVTITRASLANWKMALEQNMGIGAKVLVSRRNDVIPKIEKVIVKGDSLVIPKHCPACDGDTAFDKNEAGEELAYLICTNPNCISKLGKRISKWLDVHGVKNIGDSIIDTLVAKNFVNDLYSFLILPFNLDALDVLKGMDGFGTRKINIITSGIESTYKSNLQKVIAGYNFKNFGRSRTEEMLKASKAETFEEFVDFVNSPNALTVAGFGSETILSLRKQLIPNLANIKRILEIVKIEKQTYQDGGVLEGLSICITGPLVSMSRPKMQELIKIHGGKPASSVSSSTTHLVTNETTPTSKFKKATGFGIPVITEKEFLEMIDMEVEAELPDAPIEKSKPVKQAPQPVIKKSDDLFDINDL